MTKSDVRSRHTLPRSALLAALVVATSSSLVACRAPASEGRQCVFNDDCANPLVCAANACRAQCRSDRDCPPMFLCSPSPSPEKNVCLPQGTPALCASDDDCPNGAACAANQCWWRCANDPECGAHNAGMCVATRRVCQVPITVDFQRQFPRTITEPPLDGGLDGSTGNDGAIATDAAPNMDATTPDSAMASDSATADSYVADPCRDAGDCAFGNGTGRCEGGRCVLDRCNAGFEDCDHFAGNGCEVDTRADPNHCGACDARCNTPPNGAGNACVAGVCAISACAAGFADCNSAWSDGCEVDTRSNTAHCGACNAACPDLTMTGGAQSVACVASRCEYTMCRAGRADCDMDRSNGCEVDTTATEAHCGGCGMSCTAGANQSARCVSSACARTCRAGFGDCNASGADGCEIALDADINHCGTCGRRCAGTEVCANGACVASAFAANGATMAFNPVSDTTLPSGEHRFTSVRIPAGVTVRTNAPGVLQILSQGPVVIEGIIDVSGGRGGDGASADGAMCVGGNGFGGDVGTAVAARNGIAGMNATGGVSGLGYAGDCGIQNPITMAGTNGGGAGGSPSLTASAAGGGGGYAGGGGGGGSGGCTFCAGGRGGGTMDYGVGAGGLQGGQGAYQASSTYNASSGRPGDTTTGGGGGGGSIGSVAAMDLLVNASLTTGSSGGGGGTYSSAEMGGACTPAAVGGGGGGGAGGALRIASATSITIAATGAVLARGGNGGNGAVSGARNGGGGGGGSGGVIHLWTPQLSTFGTISVAGGAGGRGNPMTAAGTGGTGSLGRLKIDVLARACVLSGSIAPALVAGCAEATTPARTVISYIR